MTTLPAARVVIVGGGFGGLETALYLRRRLGNRADVTLVADRSHFLFRPYLTYVPFGLVPDEVRFDLDDVSRAKGIAFVHGRAETLDPERGVVRVGARTLPYDYLVVATGARIGPEPIPGLYEHGYTIWQPDDMTRLREAVQRMVDEARAGASRSVVFCIPPACLWAGPLYEMAFMLATWLDWKGVRDRVRIVLSTAESSFMEALEHEVHAVVEDELGRRGLEGRTGRAVRRVEPNALVHEDGTREPYDLLVTTSAYTAAAGWAPLPTDARGFIRTDLPTRRVADYPNVYAVGDASDYPVKQAFLALLQADAAAEDLAGRILDETPAFRFEPHTIWMMEQLDQAVFARLPLSADAVADEEAAEVDRLPVGLLRRMMVSTHLPRAYGANPLYAGLFWKGTKVGLKILSHLTQDG